MYAIIVMAYRGSPKGCLAPWYNSLNFTLCLWCSTWVMLNTLTRRLAKMPDEMRAKMQYLAPHPSR